MRLTITGATGAHVQDLGRRRAHQGLATGGARDQHAARLANAMTGRAPDEPLVEIVLGELRLVPDRDALVAVTGAAVEASIGGVPVVTDGPLVVPAGAELRIRVVSGVAACLAVAGDWRVPRTAGGAGPDPGLGIDTALMAGAALVVDGAPRRLTVPAFGVGLLRPGTEAPTRGTVVDLVAGPDLDDGLRAAIADGPFAVDPRSDHVGVRFRGALPASTVSGERPSRGAPIGALELPGAPGELIALQRGRSLTAGYPIVAVVGSAAQDLVAQLRPGDAVSFRWRTVTEVRRALADRIEFERNCRIRVTEALSALRETSSHAPDPPVLGSEEVE